MTVNREEKFSMYGSRFILKDLRDLVEQTKHLTDHSSVAVSYSAGDRPYESGSYTIAVSSMERMH